MKVNLMLFSLFLLVSIMACNVFALSILVVVVRRAIKRRKKRSNDNSLYKISAIAGDFVEVKILATIKPHRRNHAHLSDKGELSYSSCAIASVTWQVSNHV